MQIPVVREITPTGLEVRANNVAYFDAALRNGLQGHICLETVDLSRQRGVVETDSTEVYAFFIHERDNCYWRVGCGLDNDFKMKEAKVSVNYPSCIDNSTRFDLIKFLPQEQIVLLQIESNFQLI